MKLYSWIEFVVALCGLIVLAPVILFLILAIRLDSPGPGLFRQKRIGRHCKPFTCYKLRTMASGTPNVPTHDAQSSYITRLGRFLRGTKLDELPQLWNVVNREMSFVGPRPCLETQTELIEERHKRGVFEILPGITGLAQIQGIDMADPVKLAEVDAEYVRRRTPRLDVEIIFRTVFGGAGRGDRVRS
jgi:Sugar transferases involved in lipopolysaccharide synthesis